MEGPSTINLYPHLVNHGESHKLAESGRRLSATFSPKDDQLAIFLSNAVRPVSCIVMFICNCADKEGEFVDSVIRRHFRERLRMRWHQRRRTSIWPPGIQFQMRLVERYVF